MSDTSPQGEMDPEPDKAPRLGADLWTRLGSAVVMAIGALALTWAGGWWFAALVMIGGCIIVWEWAGITGGDQSGPAFLVQCATVVGLIVAVMQQAIWIGPLPLWGAILLIGAALVTVLTKTNHPGRAITGLLYAALPCAALVWFRNDPGFGLQAVCFLFVVVWATDIMAYVFGRYFGGPKLWPAVSPKKTWSGALGGITGAILGSIAVASYVPGAGIFRLMVIAFVLSALSQLGDLAESSLKRRYDVKDSSHLIPGHGGLLDRVDGLLFAVFAAAVFVLTQMYGSPAAALLLGAAP